MTDEQRQALTLTLRGGQAEHGDPVRPAGLADQGVRGRLRQGRRRQVLRHRQPGRRAGRRTACRSASSTRTSTATRSRGCSASSGRPTQVEDMIMPPSAHGVKVISIGMFTPGNAPVVWRGPMLHRALQQFLADVYWGDLDVLLLDLPPGHRRRRDLARPAAAQRRDPRRHHPAAGRRGGRRAGRHHRAADPPADRRRRREHVLARPAGRHADGDRSVPAAGRPWPRR